MSIRLTLAQLRQAPRLRIRPEALITHLGMEYTGRQWRELMGFFCNHDVSKLTCRSLAQFDSTVWADGYMGTVYGHMLRCEEGELYLSLLVQRPEGLREYVYDHLATHRSPELEDFRCEAMEPPGATRLVLTLLDIGRHFYADTSAHSLHLAKLAHALCRHADDFTFYLTQDGFFATTAAGDYLAAMPHARVKADTPAPTAAFQGV